MQGCGRGGGGGPVGAGEARNRLPRWRFTALRERAQRRWRGPRD